MLGHPTPGNAFESCTVRYLVVPGGVRALILSL
jgi:hypothetical protein